jgi:thioredoxin-dependent peroxiredoxin
MHHKRFPGFSALVCALFALLTARMGAAESAMPPATGDAAPNFTLRTLDDRAIELKSLVAKQPVVLVVLRGWPGYQCPLCTRQVHDFVAHATEFKQRGAQVLMVYPGPARELEAHAQDFLKDKTWPVDFLFVVDPDYTFTNAYGLRWEAKNETAYPSTFVIGRDGTVQFANVSKTHGGRIAATRALDALK